MKPRDAIDVVVEKLPPPGKKPGGGGSPMPDDASPDEEGSEGEGAAFDELASSAGWKPVDRGAAIAALKDFVRICGGSYGGE